MAEHRVREEPGGGRLVDPRGDRRRRLRTQEAIALRAAPGGRLTQARLTADDLVTHDDLLVRSCEPPPAAWAHHHSRDARRRSSSASRATMRWCRSWVFSSAR